MIFVEDEEVASGTLIERVYGISERSFFREQLRGKGIEVRCDRFTFQHGLAYWQTTPEIGPAGDGLYEQLAKRRQGTTELAEEGSTDLPERHGRPTADASFVGAVAQDGAFAK